MASSSKTIRAPSGRPPLRGSTQEVGFDSFYRRVLIWLISVVVFVLIKTEDSLGWTNSSTRGSSQGFFTPQPSWSAGLQLGSHGSSGLSAQMGGFYNGAIDIGLGVFSDLTLSVDYIRALRSGFHMVSLSPKDSYRPLRGNLILYFGGGGHLGRGFSLRLPIGISYCMLRDPIQFFGGLNLMIGLFNSQNRGIDFGLQFGMRLLI